MAPRDTAATKPITCPKCGSSEFVRVVGGITLVVPLKFDEATRQIRLRFDREEQREPDDGQHYYKRYCCAACDTELPDPILDRINDQEYTEISEA
jgi:DNA-directed RNA polymerase subunit RPC12/RpoP